MKTIVTVESFNAMRQRKLERAHQLDHGEALAPEKRISFETPELLLACMTPQRLRLLDAARDQPRSVTELATFLHRERKSVHRDIRALHSAGILKLAKRTNPGHGQIQVVQAAARNLELRVRL